MADGTCQSVSRTDSRVLPVVAGWAAPQYVGTDLTFGKRLEGTAHWMAREFHFSNSKSKFVVIVIGKGELFDLIGWLFSNSAARLFASLICSSCKPDA